MNMPDLQPLMPEIVFLGLALFVLLAELFIKSKETIGLMVIVSVAATAYMIPQSFGVTFSGMFISDGYSSFFKFIFLLNLILTILISIQYIQIERAEFGEYYTVLMFSTLGMMIMASAGDLIVLYLGLELMALSTYILAGFIRHDARSTESALKYFLLGAFSSAILLYGIMLLYGLTGTTDIMKLSSLLMKNGMRLQSIFAIVMVMVAFGFKIALVPFHMWAPDVYEGAPTSITAFMSVGPKAAGFAVIGRVFLTGLEGFSADWRLLLVVLSIATMAVGNIIAIQQHNLKRMLAYSSIAHAGYAVLGVIAGNTEGLSATMNYLLIYAFMNIGAFSVLVLLRNEQERIETLEQIKGLARNHPFASALMLIFMFSLTGIPPTAGFVGKFFLFRALVYSGYTWLAVVAVVFSAISAYFYLRVVMYMYMYEPEEGVTQDISTAAPLGLALLITSLMVIAIGIYPEPFVNFARLVVG